MPLDCHLFSDFKFDVRRFANRWPGSFSRSTPGRLWALMVGVWKSGCSPSPARILEDCGHWERNLDWIVERKGALVPELNCRHGRRLKKRKERRAASRKMGCLRRRLPKLETLLEHMPASSTPDEPEFNVIKMPDPPTAAEIDGFPRENRASDGFPGLRQRCEVLGLEVQGSPAQLKARLKVYFGHQQPAPGEAAAAASSVVTMYVPRPATAAAAASSAGSATAPSPFDTATVLAKVRAVIAAEHGGAAAPAAAAGAAAASDSAPEAGEAGKRPGDEADEDDQPLSKRRAKRDIRAPAWHG